MAIHSTLQSRQDLINTVNTERIPKKLKQPNYTHSLSYRNLAVRVMKVF